MKQKGKGKRESGSWFSVLKTRNKILAIVGGAIGAVLLYTLVFYSIKGWLWDGLFPYMFGGGGIEAAITGWITVTEKKNKKEN